MTCPECDYDNDPGADVCNLCGASLERDTSDAPRSASGREDSHRGEKTRSRSASEDAERLYKRRRNRRMYIDHPVAGALLYATMLTLFGLPGSLHPVNLLTNLGISVLFGAPMGFLISVVRGGQFMGGVVGTGFMFVAMILLRVLEHGWGVPPVGGLFWLLVISILSGGLPGLLIGFHVKIDDV